MNDTTAQEVSPRKPTTRPIRMGLDFKIDGQAVQSLLDDLTERIGRIVEKELARLNVPVKTDPVAEVPQPVTKAVQGIEVAAAEKYKAADLRTAMLIGKVPEDAGILIDTPMAAKLLSVSARTLWKLDQLQAMPEPVRIGRLVRWRLAELLEWVDSDCPPRRAWVYSGYQGKRKHKRT